MSKFEQYPKVMKHPAYRPAVVAKWDPKIKDPKDQVQGSSAKFPEVIVHNLDQEQQYASLGYKPNGVGDPEAYRKAMTGNEMKPDGSEKEYPKWLYRATTDGERGENGHDTTSKLVNSKEEEKALGKGWFRTPDQARSGEPAGKPTTLSELTSAGRDAQGAALDQAEQGKPQAEARKAPVKAKKAQSKAPTPAKKAGKGKRSEART